MVDFYEYSKPELVRLLGSRFKEYRMQCNLTQREVAEQSGIGLTTIHKFENGMAGNLYHQSSESMGKRNNVVERPETINGNKDLE